MGRVRRLVVALIADMVSSTETRIALGELRANLVETRVLSLLRHSVRDHDGHHLRSTGDGAVALFDTPSAAVTTAVDVQRRAQELRSSSGFSAGLRVGISLGEVEYEDGDLETVQGFPMLVAARLCAAAPPGSALCDEAVIRAREHWREIEIGPVQPVRCKGIVEPVRACIVSLAASERALPGELAPLCGTPMIGRQPELEHITGLIDQSSTLDRPILITLSGPPGIGKSRVAAQLCRNAASSQSVSFASARAHQLPFATLKSLLPEPASTILGGSAGGADQGALFAGVQTALDTSETRAVHFVDDAQWLEPSELDLLTFLFRHGRTGRLFLLTSRLALADLEPRLVHQTRSHDVAMGPLDSPAARALVRSLLPPAVATEGAVDEIADGGHGSPLMLSLLARSEAVRALAGGQVAGPTGEIAEVIGRRLTELGPRIRQVLVAAAVLQRTDSTLLTQALKTTPESVREALTAGVRAGLLRADDADVTFFHSLVREAVADTASEEEVRDLHGHAARWLSEQPNRDEIALASHLLAAGRPASECREACERAAAVANVSRAYATAAEWLDRSASFAKDLRDRLAIQIRAVEAEHLSGRGDVRQRAHALSRSCLDAGLPALATDALFAVDRGLFSAIGTCDRELIGLAEECLAQLPDSEDDAVRLQAMVASELTFADGDLEQVRRTSLAGDAIEVVRSTDNLELKAQVLTSCAMALRDPDSIPERRRLCGELYDLAQELENDWYHFAANEQLGAAALENCEVEMANRCVRQALTYAHRLGQPRAKWISGLMATGLAINQGDLAAADFARKEAERHGLEAGFLLEARIPSAEQELEILRWSGRLSERASEIASWAGDDTMDFVLAGLKYLALAGPHPAIEHWIATHDIEAFLTRGPRILEGPRLIHLTMVLLCSENKEALETVYARLSELESTWFQTTVSLGSTAHHCALVAAALGDRHAAQAHFGVALGHHRPEHAALWWAETVRQACDLGFDDVLATEDAEQVREVLAQR